jgi:hypothetical protein
MSGETKKSNRWIELPSVIWSMTLQCTANVNDVLSLSQCNAQLWRSLGSVVVWRTLFQSSYPSLYRRIVNATTTTTTTTTTNATTSTLTTKISSTSSSMMTVTASDAGVDIYSSLTWYERYRNRYETANRLRHGEVLPFKEFIHDDFYYNATIVDEPPTRSSLMTMMLKQDEDKRSLVDDNKYVTESDVKPYYGMASAILTGQLPYRPTRADLLRASKNGHIHRQPLRYGGILPNYGALTIKAIKCMLDGRIAIADELTIRIFNRWFDPVPTSFLTTNKGMSSCQPLSDYWSYRQEWPLLEGHIIEYFDDNSPLMTNVEWREVHEDLTRTSPVGGMHQLRASGHNHRFFSVHMNGSVMEWDLRSTPPVLVQTLWSPAHWRVRLHRQTHTSPYRQQSILVDVNTFNFQSTNLIDGIACIFYICQ